MTLTLTECQSLILKNYLMNFMVKVERRQLLTWPSRRLHLLQVQMLILRMMSSKNYLMICMVLVSMLARRIQRQPLAVLNSMTMTLKTYWMNYTVRVMRQVLLRRSKMWLMLEVLLLSSPRLLHKLQLRLLHQLQKWHQ